MAETGAEQSLIDASIPDEPELASLDVGDGVAAWAAIAALVTAILPAIGVSIRLNGKPRTLQ
jgi:hypothetical protein